MTRRNTSQGPVAFFSHPDRDLERASGDQYLLVELDEAMKNNKAQQKLDERKKMREGRCRPWATANETTRFFASAIPHSNESSVTLNEVKSFRASSQQLGSATPKSEDLRNWFETLVKRNI